MNTLEKDFKAAFGSMWALMGVLISAVAVFNFLSRVLKIGLSELFAQLLGAFRNVFHPIIEFLTGWAIPWLPFLALPEWKDGFLLWFVAGGAVLRTLLVHRTNLGAKSDEADPLDHFRIGSLWIQLPSAGTGVGQILRIVLSLVAWPIGLLAILSTPIIAYSAKNDNFLSYRREYRLISLRDGTYRYDLQHVWAMQLAAVFGVVTILTLLNAAGVG
jgi:hypothetical protein